MINYKVFFSASRNVPFTKKKKEEIWGAACSFPLSFLGFSINVFFSHNVFHPSSKIVSPEYKKIQMLCTQQNRKNSCLWFGFCSFVCFLKSFIRAYIFSLGSLLYRLRLKPVNENFYISEKLKERRNIEDNNKQEIEIHKKLYKNCWLFSRWKCISCHCLL